MHSTPNYLRRYRLHKDKHPGEVLLTRRPFSLTHAAFDDDAVRVADACEVPTVTIIAGDERVKAALINSAGIVQAIQKLDEAGHKVAVLDD